LDSSWIESAKPTTAKAAARKETHAKEVALTNQEAIKVLQELHHYHNKQYGIKWVDVTSYIEEYALGRKLTKAEVKRFVEKNLLTIDQKRQ
jgi:hypothetical protein